MTQIDHVGDLLKLSELADFKTGFENCPRFVGYNELISTTVFEKRYILFFFFIKCYV